jgi:hypothetical protein
MLRVLPSCKVLSGGTNLYLPYSLLIMHHIIISANAWSSQLCSAILFLQNILYLELTCRSYDFVAVYRLLLCFPAVGFVRVFFMNNNNPGTFQPNFFVVIVLLICHSHSFIVLFALV